jgi:hypothetical protein
VRDRGHRKPAENRTKARKIEKVGQNLSENILNWSYFITILTKNSGKLSTPPSSQKASAPRTLMVFRGVATEGNGGLVTPFFFPKLRRNWVLAHMVGRNLVMHSSMT